MLSLLDSGRIFLFFLYTSPLHLLFRRISFQLLILIDSRPYDILYTGTLHNLPTQKRFYFVLQLRIMNIFETTRTKTAFQLYTILLCMQLLSLFNCVLPISVLIVVMPYTTFILDERSHRLPQTVVSTHSSKSDLAQLHLLLFLGRIQLSFLPNKIGFYKFLHLRH